MSPSTTRALLGLLLGVSALASCSSDEAAPPSDTSGKAGAAGSTGAAGKAGTAGKAGAAGTAGKAGAGGTTTAGAGGTSAGTGGTTTAGAGGTTTAGTGGTTTAGTGGTTTAGAGGSTTAGTGGSTTAGTGGTSTAGAGGTTSAGTGGTSSGGAGGSTPTGPKGAGDLAVKLGRKRQFLWGLGNDIAGADKNYDHDKDGIWSLEAKLDVHYAYLSGTGWPDYNPGGLYANIIADSAKKHGVVPMFTLYQMATIGDGNLAGLSQEGFMKDYWAGAKILFQRLAVFDDRAIVQIEPDFLGYVYLQAPQHDPTKIKALVGSVFPDCAGLPEDVTGWGACLVKIARQYAPKTVIGFHASGFGATAQELASILEAVHEKEADFMSIDPLDRDAGCFEAKLPGLCEREGKFYWDETNQTSPNFHEHFAYVKGLHDVLAKPVIWWQVPLGKPSNTPGGTPGKYRDNRVRYFFSHVQELIDVGGLGAVFGVGSEKQTYIQSDGGTDGGQFDTAAKAYYAAPVALP